MQLRSCATSFGPPAMLSFNGPGVPSWCSHAPPALLRGASQLGENPWNGVVAGSITGEAVHIALAAMQGKVIISTCFSGSFQSDSIEGHLCAF
jgi:hypothetical protein